MEKNIFVLPVESSVKRPPILAFFSTSLALVITYLTVLATESISNLIYAEAFLRIDLENISSFSFALVIAFLSAAALILKQKILRSIFLNRVYFSILNKTIFKILFVAFNLLILLAILNSQVTYESTYSIVDPLRFVAILIFTYSIAITLIRSINYKKNFKLIDNLRNSSFADSESKKKTKFTTRKQSFGVTFTYFNLGTLDLVNQKEDKIMVLEDKLNRLFEDHEKITKRFNIFLLDLPPNFNSLNKDNKHVKSIILRLELSNKGDSLDKIESFFDGLSRTFERISVLNESEIKYFYLYLLGFANSGSTNNVKNIKDIDDIFLGLNIKRILEDRIEIETKLNNNMLNSTVYFSSLYNIENNTNFSSQDNIYTFSETPFSNLLNKLDSNDYKAVLTFERIKNNSGKDNELNRRVSKGIDHKSKDLAVIEQKIDKSKISLMKKSHEEVEKNIKYDSSGSYYIIQVDAICTNLGASTFRTASKGVETEVINQNFVQHYSLKNLLGISSLENDYTFLSSNFLIKNTTLFRMGIFSQENSYEEGAKSIFLGKLKDSKKEEQVRVDMGKYQSKTGRGTSNGHMVILAKSGHGKTTLMMSLLYQKLAFNNQQVIILDKEPEYDKFGEEVKLAIEQSNIRKDFSVKNYTSKFIDQNSINPFEIPLTEKQISQLKDKDYLTNNYNEFKGEFENHISVLISFFNGIIEKVNDEISKRLNDKLKKIINNTYSLNESDQRQLANILLNPPNLNNFKEKLKKELSISKLNSKSHKIDLDVEFALKGLAEELKENNELNKYFSSSKKSADLSDVLNTTDLIIFDTSDLIKTKEKRLYFMFLINYLKVLITATDIVNTGISKNTKFSGGRALFVDELHTYFDKNESLGGSIFITDFLKDAATRFRKRNVELIVASQTTTFSKLEDKNLRRNAEEVLSQASYRFYGKLNNDDEETVISKLNDVLTDKDKEQFKFIQTPTWAYSVEGQKLKFVDIEVHPDVKEFVINKISRKSR